MWSPKGVFVFFWPLFFLHFFSNDRFFFLFFPHPLADCALVFACFGCFVSLCLSGCCLAAVWLLSGSCFTVWLLSGCCFAVWLLSACCFAVLLLSGCCFVVWLLPGCCFAVLLLVWLLFCCLAASWLLFCCLAAVWLQFCCLAAVWPVCRGAGHLSFAPSRPCPYLFCAER